jgi:hypothetical protein
VPPLPKQAPGLMDQLGKFLGADVLAAAGPIGAVALGAQQLTTQLEAMRKTVGRVTEGLEGLAQNQLPSARGFGDAIADFQETIPIIGSAMAAQTRLTQDIAQLPEKISQAFLNRAHQIAQYSGPISAAEAMANVRNIKADIREARELGPGMARMVDAQSRIEQDVREILLPIKKFVVEVLAERLELLADAARVILRSPELAQAILKESLEALALLASAKGTEAIKKIDELPEKLAKILQRQDDNPGILFDNFLRDFGAARFGAP